MLPVVDAGLSKEQFPTPLVEASGQHQSLVFLRDIVCLDVKSILINSRWLARASNIKK